jgi:hypothetical protein
MPVGAGNPVTAVDVVFPSGRGQDKFGSGSTVVWDAATLVYLCRYDSPT